MLTLICGTAVARERRRRLELPAVQNTMFVVPDELTARALAFEIFGLGQAVVDDRNIVVVDDLLERLMGGQKPARRPVPPNIAAAIVRNILESSPKAFDYLVGRDSVPRLSPGVLDRIIASLDTIRQSQETEDDRFVSFREKQLRLLADKLTERLDQAGCQLEKYVTLEAIESVPTGRWSAFLGTMDHVVFLDFTSGNDVLYHLVHSMARRVDKCDILLDFDPEAEAGSPLDEAYIRFYDMAERVLLNQDDISPELAGKEAPVHRVPMIVPTETVAAEVEQVASAVGALLALDPANPLSIVLAVTNMENYAPALDKELAAHGIHALWHQRQAALGSGIWLLMERLRDTAGRGVTGSQVTALFRAPGFSSLLDKQIGFVEAWDLASRLEYVLTLTGQLTGWKNIIRGTAQFLERLHADRRKRGQLSAAEENLDLRLLEVLTAIRETAGRFESKETVNAWAIMVMELLCGFGEAAQENDGSASSPFQVQILEEIKTVAMQMVQFAGIISEKPVRFRHFVSLFRTALQSVQVDNSESLPFAPVVVCPPGIASSLHADCVLLLGCNDGNFPRFARPDASFLPGNSRHAQLAFRGRQRQVLNRIIRNYERCFLWMPKRDGVEDLLPSQFVEDLQDSGMGQNVTPEELLASLKGSGRKRQPGGAEAEFVELLSSLSLSTGELKRFRQRGQLVHNMAHSTSVVAGRKHPNLAGHDAIITDPVLRKWLKSWADRHIYSVSQLDTVVGCSFRFYVDRILNLDELEEADDLLPAHTFGSFTHDVLARFYRQWVAEGRGVPSFADEALARERLVQAYEVEHEKTDDLSEFARDLLNLKLFGEFEIEEFEQGEPLLEDAMDPGVLGQFLLMEMTRGSNPGMDFLKPSNFEVGFGMGKMEEDDPLSRPEYLDLDLGEGVSIKLRGRIDRIDVSPTGVFAVTDYKTGRLPDKKQILAGLKTQLPVYTLVGRELLKAKFEAPEAAGGLYYSLKKGDSVKVSGVFLRAAYQAQAGVGGRSCLKDEDFDEALEKVKGFMRHSMQAVKQGYLTTTWRDADIVCKYCPFEGFCYRDVERTAEFWKETGFDVAAEE